MNISEHTNAILSGGVIVPFMDRMAFFMTFRRISRQRRVGHYTYAARIKWRWQIVLSHENI